MMYVLAFCLGLSACNDPQQGVYSTEADCREAIVRLKEVLGDVTVVRDCEAVPIESL